MQGIGFLIAVAGYGLLFTAYEQAFGDGGSFLYWFTGNPKLGQPATSQGKGKNQGQGSPQDTSYTNKSRPPLVNAASGGGGYKGG